MGFLTAREADAPFMTLRQYRDCKYVLAECLRALPWRAETVVRNRLLFERLAMDRFNIAVVGRYSRGKSTLLNAMTGLDRLPMGAEPLTSVITSLAYGSEEKVVLHFRGTSLIEDVPLAQLADYVTERGNPGNVRRVEEAEILLPSSILRAGFRFIDTPGLGSIIRANTETTLAFLEQIDAFILVSAFDDLLGPDEEGLLRDIGSTGKPLFPVVNKIDLATDDEAVRATVERFRHGLVEAGLPPDVVIFPLSARNALSARLERGDDALRRSGLPALETAVTEFLLSRRQQVFLRGMCDRIAAALKEDGRETPALLARLDAVRSISVIGASDAEDGDMTAAWSGDIPPCPVCVRVERAVFDHLTALQHDLRCREEARRTFRSENGLCSGHSRLFARLAAPCEIATAFAPLLRDESRRLSLRAMEADRRDPPVSVSGMAETRCAACAAAERGAVEAIGRLAAAMERDPEASAGGKSDQGLGLCRRHFEQVLDRVGTSAVRAFLLKRQAALFERRADDMARFALKQDAARRDAMTPAEKVAPRAGLTQWAGPEPGGL
ncbi:hypothetical protein AA0498_2111 [Acidomonas methanolica]|nr:hypothetical protein AA0498_2111 [Acidomonas methanolica]